MKKAVAIILAAVSLFAMSLLGGCSTNPYEYEKEEGFFVYKKIKREDHVVITGFTELGNQQEVIVMPETINGCKYSFCHYRGKGYGLTRFDTIILGANDSLQKIYFEYDLVRWGVRGEYDDITFKDFSALTKVFINSRAALSYSNNNKNAKIYTCYGYVYKRKNENDEKKGVFSSNRLADVQFMYNYDESPNKGYYWIDDVEDGEKIEIIPPDPKREGYTFAGWYCEPECENEWSFENTIRKTEVNPGDFYPDDYVTYIYAKWIAA